MHHADAHPTISRSAPMPVMVGVERHAIGRAPDHAARLFESLLGRVVAELAQGLPVLLTPEQLPCSLDAQRITAGFRILQPGRNLVVDNDRGNGPQVGRAHAAERMLTKKRIAGLLPAIAVATLRTTSPPLTAHAGCLMAPH